MTARKSCPGLGAEAAAEERFAGATAILPPVAGHGSALRTLANVAEVDLRHLDPHTVYRLVQWAAHEPAGTFVVFRVSGNQMPEFGALEYLRANGEHLGRVEFRCPDAATRRRWAQAMTGVTR